LKENVVKLSSKLARAGFVFVGARIRAMIAIFLSSLALLSLSVSPQVVTHLRDAAILSAMIGTVLIGVAVAQATGERNAERQEGGRAGGREGGRR
jgi:hypothetical protein